MPKFESKFTANDLVEYEPSKQAERNLFAFVRAIHFHKSDAVNFAASYTLEIANTQEIKRDVSEHQILKRYVLDERPRQ